MIVDGRGEVAAFNGDAQRLLPGLAVGQPFSLALRDPLVLDALATVVATGQPGAVETGGRTANDPVHEVRLRRTDGATVLFFRDVTSAREIERMRSDFVANVSHELRTPLAALSGFIDTLQGAAREDKAARERFLGIMAAQADRMRRLIEDLLQLSRLESGAHRAPATPIDLGASVSHMAELTAPLARGRNVAVALNLPERPTMILANRDEVLRLIENLLENAIKYGGEGGRVEVSVRPAGTAAELAIRDHGPGIAREHIPRLTERFYRVDKGTSRAQGGTGLGLAIVKHIASRHRARLVIESEPGQGATFRVTFPLAPSAGIAGERIRPAPGFHPDCHP